MMRKSREEEEGQTETLNTRDEVGEESVQEQRSECLGKTGV